jgi:hypothetical protein
MIDDLSLVQGRARVKAPNGAGRPAPSPAAAAQANVKSGIEGGSVGGRRLGARAVLDDFVAHTAINPSRTGARRLSVAYRRQLVEHPRKPPPPGPAANLASPVDAPLP